ncbi:MAG: crosslink repair DNA glycosylase YcaQ family protein, partial [Bacteroidia bacterium]
TIEIEGETYYQCSEQSELRDDERVHFLPAYDEFIIAFQDKFCLFRKAEYLPQVAKSGVFYPMIVHRGWIIGKWKARLIKENIVIEYQLFDTTSQPTYAQLAAGIELYSHFMERSVQLKKLN